MSLPVFEAHRRINTLLGRAVKPRGPGVYAPGAAGAGAAGTQGRAARPSTPTLPGVTINLPLGTYICYLTCVNEIFFCPTKTATLVLENRALIWKEFYTYQRPIFTASLYRV